MTHVDIPPPRVCPYCQSPDLASVEPRVGPHRRKLCCRNCGKHLRWLPGSPSAPTPEQARAYRMPFGKYKGTTLGAIVATPDGSRYLTWLLSEADLRPGLARKLRMALGGIAAEAPGRSG